MTDYLIVGLGNPGAKHAGQRHNVGFACINRLAHRHAVQLRSSRLTSSGEGKIGAADVLLVRPRTFVNGSGRAVAPLLKSHGLQLSQLIVIYDELDLPEGRIRLRPGGGAGGHNGLKSIIEATGGGDFGRVRVGIGRPLLNGVPSWDPEAVMRYVLAQPPRAGREALEAAVEQVCDAVEAVTEDGWERAMNLFNSA